MKHFILFIVLSVVYTSWGQYDGNTSPDYPALIKIYEDLADAHEEIELYQMGASDHGLPIYLCVLNGAHDSVATFNAAKSSTTVLINNAIHPGEPDGVNACLIWINQWIEDGKPTDKMPIIAIIPAYNVGGMMNRSGTSRANQNGPEEYGFRGNAQNLDLNRDFIKMDSKNMFTFARIYHALEPDVFLDTHVSNGADYQYTMTYIASIRERMAPELGNLMYEHMIPYLSEMSSKKGFDLVPYVHLKDETPESGIEAFNDLPRYAMGYASLLNSLSFTLETHMLKPFPERVKSTLVFIDETINWVKENSTSIEQARIQALAWEDGLEKYSYNYKLTDEKDSLLFKGYDYSKPKSEVTGLERLKYHRDKPYEKYVPYYHTYESKKSVSIPDFIIVGSQCENVIERLGANQIDMKVVTKNAELELDKVHVMGFANGSRPYEGHYLHNQIEVKLIPGKVQIKKGDRIISTHQKNRRFLLSVLYPESPDSYFAWNLFDSYVQQKEYFSPYVFEDKAKQILESDNELNRKFIELKATDDEFAKSAWEQLYFIYRNSEFYEPTHNFIPVYFGNNH